MPIIKTSLIAAAITVAATTALSGSASATAAPVDAHTDHSTTQMLSPEEREQLRQKQVKIDEYNRDQAEKQHQQQVKLDEIERNRIEDLHQQQVKLDEAARNKAEVDRQASIKQQEQNNHVEKSQAQENLRVGLNNLLREHVTTNLVTNRSIVSNAPQPQIDAGMKAQMANTHSLAMAIGSIYGMDAQMQFTTLFNEHIVESNAIAAAVASGDMEAQKEATLELEEYLTDISNFFSTAIPVLPNSAVYALLAEHESLINQSTEAFKHGDYTRSYELEAKALTQVSVIADALTKGIVVTQTSIF